MNNIPCVIGWCDHRHAVMKKSGQTFSNTTAIPTANHPYPLYSHQRSQLVIERYRCSSGQRKRLFSGTTSSVKNDKDDGGEVVGSGDNNRTCTHEE